MIRLNRRAVLAGAVAMSATRLFDDAHAQNTPSPAAFGQNDVIKRARELANAPFDASIPPLPNAIANLDYDS